MAINVAIRWADNTAELRTNLKQGLDQIEATTAAANRMADTIGGVRLTQSAHNYAAALETIGQKGGSLAGIAQLTSREIERGNQLLDKAITKYAAMGQTAPQALRDIAAALGKANDAANVDKVSTSLGGGALLKEANTYAQALEKVGGIEKLTASQRQQGNATIDQAVEKYHALGTTASREVSTAAAAFAKLAASEQQAAAVKNIASTLGGDKLIQEAHNYVAALAQVGGAERLTAANRAQVNTAMTAAIEQYRVMGRTAPQALLDTASATHQVTAATSGWGSILSSVWKSTLVQTAAGVLMRDMVRGLVNEIKSLLVVLPQIAMEGAAVADVEENFKHLTAEAGRLGSTLMTTLRDATHHTITDFELMQLANKDLTAGLNLTDKEFGTLAKGAFALSQSTPKMGMVEAFEAMNKAMLTGQTRGAAGFLGKIDIDAAEQRYAKSLGSTAEHLTTNGKLHAAQQEILSKTADMIDRLGEQTDGLDERVAQVDVTWKNFTNDLGKTIATSKTLEDAMVGVGGILLDAFGDSRQAGIRTIADLVDDLTINMVRFGKVGITVAANLETAFYGLRKVLRLVAAGDDSIAMLDAQSTRAVSATFIYPGSEKQNTEANAEIARIKARQAARLLEQDADSSTQRVIGSTADETRKKFDDLIERLVAGRKAVAEFVGPVQDREGPRRDFVGRQGGGPELQVTKGELAAAAAAAKKFADAMSELDSVGTGFQTTLDGIDGSVVEAVKYYLAAGVGQSVLTTAYALTDVQVKAVAESMKQEIEQRKIHGEMLKVEAVGMNANAAEWLKLGIVIQGTQPAFEKWKALDAELQDQVNKRTLTTTAYQEAAIDAWLKKELDAMDKDVEATTENKNKVIAIAKEKKLALHQILTQTEDAMTTSVFAQAAAEADRVPIALHKVIATTKELQIAFQNMALVVGGTFGKILSGAASMAGLFSAVGDANRAYQKDPSALNLQALNASKKGAIYGGAAIAGGLVAQSINTGAGASTRNLVESYGIQGAVAGSVVPGIGTGIGAAAGAAYGWYESSKEWRKVFNDTARDFAGIKVSEEFAKTIEDLEDQTGLQRVQALTTQLDKLIEQAGGLSKVNFDMFFGKLHDAFSYLAQHQLTLAQTTQIVEKNFEAFATVGTDAYGRINDSVRELIALDTEYGTHAQAITKWLGEQAAGIGAGVDALLTQPMIVATTDLGAAVREAQDAVDKQKASIDTAKQGTDGYKTATTELQAAQDKLTEALSAQHAQAERTKGAMDDLGLTVVLAFNAGIAAGKGFVETLISISPQLHTIAKAYEDLGLSIGDAGEAMHGLLLENEILTGKDGKGGVGKAIAGLEQIFVMSTNIPGLMDDKTFAAQQRTLDSLYVQTQAGSAAAGGDTINALMPFQRTLHEMEEWAIKNGKELDAATQEKIRQSKELGLWSFDYKSENEKSLESMAKLIASNDSLIEALGGLPSALADILQHGVTPPAAASPDNPTTGAPGTTPTGPPGRSNRPAPAPANTDMAAGGIGFASGPMTFTTAGNEYYAFSGEGQKFGREPVLARAMVGRPLPSLSSSFMPPGAFATAAAVAAKGSAFPSLNTSDLPSTTRDQMASPFVSEANDDAQRAAKTAAGGGKGVVLQEAFTFQITLPPGGNSDYVEKELMPKIIEQIEDRRRGYTGRLRLALDMETPA